jgi:PAS domain S-box-containing protein
VIYAQKILEFFAPFLERCSMTRRQYFMQGKDPGDSALADRLLTVIEATSDLIWFTSLSGEIVDESSSWGTFSGQVYADYKGTGWLQRIHPEDLERFVELQHQSIESQQIYKTECRILYRDGTYHDVAVSSRPVLNKYGEVCEWMGLGADITEMKMMSRALQVSEKKQKDAEEQRDAFIGLIIHELRTPLTSIKGNLQLALRRIKRMAQDEQVVPELVDSLGETQALLERALRQLGMQNRMISDLLDASRIASHKLVLSSHNCDLVAIIRDTVEGLRATTSGQPLLVELPESEITVFADPDRIGQALTCYINNALKYAPQDQAVAIGLDSVAGRPRVWVSDCGPGLSEQQQQHIWERFYVLKEIPVLSGNSVRLGLGLYICRMLIELQHGRVGVESQPGQGSTFWFTLPPAE